MDQTGKSSTGSEWQEIASAPLPPGLSDEEVEQLLQMVEAECQSAFLQFIDGD
jgi:hypothetical protein